MPASCPRKTVSTHRIPRGGVTSVTLEFDASPAILSCPAEVVLVLDRSGNMTAPGLAAMKAGARELVETIAAASGGRGGCLGGGTRMGLVSFGSDASADAPLTENACSLRRTIGAYTGCCGRGGLSQALRRAACLFSPDTRTRRVLILFTGGPVYGCETLAAAQALKEGWGAELFALGLTEDPRPLEALASRPASGHAFTAADPGGVGCLFREASLAVIGPGTRDAVIREMVNPDFHILRVGAPSHGTVRLTAPDALRWEIGDAGITARETVSLTFEVLHTGRRCGTLPVNRSLFFRDRAGTCLRFPSPTVTVEERCPCPPCPPEPPCPPRPPCPPEPPCCPCCPSAVELGCFSPENPGRILQLNVRLRCICPGKRVAAAVLLTELGPCGQEYARGVRFFTVPAHHEEGCRDILLSCVRFVLPEDSAPCGGCACLCRPRRFRAQVLCNYLDTDFICCDPGTALP